MVVHDPYRGRSLFLAIVSGNLEHHRRGDKAASRVVRQRDPVGIEDLDSIVDITLNGDLNRSAFGSHLVLTLANHDDIALFLRHLEGT